MQEYENQLEHLGVVGIKRKRSPKVTAPLSIATSTDNGEEGESYKQSRSPPIGKPSNGKGAKMRGTAGVHKRLENETLYNKIKFQDMNLTEIVKSGGATTVANPSIAISGDDAQMLETLD